LILKAHQMLAQEPWCFHPAQIAVLTDWQIEHLYARPALERAKQMKADTTSPTKATPEAEIPKAGDPKMEDYVIEQFMKMGMSRKKAKAKYDQQAKKAK